MDKARIVSMKGGKKKTFLDDVVKEKSGVPPANYEIMSRLIDPKRCSNLSKGRRLTMPMEIELLNKKETKPGPGTYE